MDLHPTGCPQRDLAAPAVTPNYKGIIKTFTLAFALDPAYFPVFAQQMEQALPGRLAEGDLRNSITPRVWARLIVLLLVVIGSVTVAVSQHH